MTGRLQQLKELGQSVWFDDVNRDVFQNGRLAELKERYAVTGGTSNPTIFEKAFTGSDAYEDQFRVLAERGWSAERIQDELALTDVQLAADLFRDVYDQTEGRDGYISLEVSPELAFDTEETRREVKRLADTVNRPNVMIKIPGTPAGLPAIEACLEEGINVNITLLFSIDMYAQVVEAYMSALEKRLEKGQRIDGVASVASFFVSRVDTLADERLSEAAERAGTDQEKTDLDSLMGKVGTANAKMAYARYQELFGSERWRRLADAGARVQRCLWASTSTKNPEFRDVMYVEELAGPATINTMPEPTLLAFDDHGEAEERLTKDVNGARETLQRLEQLGVSLAEITEALQHDGVQKFSDSYQAALQAIRDRVVGGVSV